MSRAVNWNVERLVVLKEAYTTAIARHHRTNDTFSFKLEGEREPVELVISYARYLIEHLETEFARHPMQRAPENKEGREGQ